MHRGSDVFRLSGSRLYDVKPACRVANRVVGGVLQKIRLTSAGQLLADGDVQGGSTVAFMKFAVCLRDVAFDSVCGDIEPTLHQIR